MATAPQVDIRILTAMEEFAATVAVQEAAWGFSPADQVPPRLFAVIHHIGGLVLGAYDGDQMVGFSLALPGLKPGGKPFWHSHMTGVAPEYQNRGVGRAIKLRQREEAFRAGLSLVEWTFDPLEIRNAHFNIESLGVVARQFIPNCYGVTSSRLHGGLPTDRLVAEWHVSGLRAARAVDEMRALEKDVQARVLVPQQIADWKQSNPERAREMQTRVREELQKYLAQGLAVIGFRRTENGGEYELGPWSESTDHGGIT